MAVNKARRFWLVCELKKQYAALSSLDSDACHLHQSLASKLTPWQFEHLLLDITIEGRRLVRVNIKSKREKLLRLKLNQNFQQYYTLKLEHIPDFLINKSTIPLTEDEENLLNKGLNFAMPNKPFPKKDLIVDVECALKSLNREKADLIRVAVKNHLSVPNNTNIDKNILHAHRTIASLNKKDLFVMKADNGNSVVVVDKSDYDSAMQSMIDDGPYKEVRNPLNKIKTVVWDMVDRYIELFPGYWKFRMLPSYRRVPRIYGLPKIHKPGNKYRPIVSNINAPNYPLSKWLCSRFATFEQFDRFSVKNSIALTEKLKNIRLESDEILVSFDISSYFTSVPVNEALNCLESWLDRQKLDHMMTDALLELTKACAEHTYFQFRGKYYEQTEGMAMGNSLSPFLCNLFINRLEEELAKDELFPSTWIRYVDDVLSVVKKDRTNDTLALINSACPQIQFTVECEQDGCLPFLDLLILHNKNGDISFDIYRKPTSSDRFITADSYHHTSHKYAAFNSMIFRMCNIPLSPENFELEKQRIYSIARQHEFSHQKTFEA